MYLIRHHGGVAGAATGVKLTLKTGIVKNGEVC
jgi:hypothetical protein